jgi:dihydroorotate dehydrogenase (fumarate)
MDLSTTYMGFELPHPLVAGAGPMSDHPDSAKRLEDAGAAAIVMRSLFEEQINEEILATHESLEMPADSFGEATSYLPDPPEFVMGPEEYLNQLSRVIEAVNIPVFGSLNGSTLGGWLEYAKLIEQAGAQALELNVYDVAADPSETGEAIERRLIEMVATVKTTLKIPLAVKLSPFYTSLANLASRIVEAGADAIVVFNRFFEPDVDFAELELQSHLLLSTSAELPLRLRWLALLSGRIDASLAVTGGVHSAEDAIKAVMCGAHAVQVVSAALKRGPACFGEMREAMSEWLMLNEYESLRQAQGSLGLLRCPNPKALERGNYMHMLQTWDAS